MSKIPNDPYNGDDGHPFDEEFHAKLLAGAHLLALDKQDAFALGWNGGKEFAVQQSNQYALGYKAGLEAAVKVCDGILDSYAAIGQAVGAKQVLVVKEAIAAIPIKGETK